MQQVENNTDFDEQGSDAVEQYLTFLLGGKVYGLEILNIKEIIEYGEITEVPMMPEFISGVINLRGSVVPVIDLSQRFSGKPTKHTKRTSIIILEVKNDDLKIEIGITVDMVNEVLDIHLGEIEPAPSLGSHIQTSFISGMAKVDGRLLILLNIENVLSIDEISLVGNIQNSTKPS
ncbi:purine-binding chemotaxis protein CheW [Beggiatoa alba]|nr:purine-binding chemotaxis protein CheW [Beggiatoa alba]